MPVQCANSDLKQPLRQPLFHNAGERTGMRHSAAFELVIQIRMRIEMNNRQLRTTRRGKVLRKSLEDRIGNRVVAPEQYRALAFLQQLAHSALNFLEIVTGG